MSWRQRAQVSDGQLRPAAARTVWCMALALGWRSRSAAPTVAKVEGLYGSFADAVPVAHNTLVAADTHTFFVFRCLLLAKASGLSGRRCARFNYNLVFAVCAD